VSKEEAPKPRERTCKQQLVPPKRTKPPSSRVVAAGAKLYGGEEKPLPSPKDAPLFPQKPKLEKALNQKVLKVRGPNANLTYPL